MVTKQCPKYVAGFLSREIVFWLKKPAVLDTVTQYSNLHKLYGSIISFTLLFPLLLTSSIFQ